MRIINADKLIEKDMNGDLINIFDVLEAPIIEAIPVEWIKKYAEEHRAYKPAFENMLADWAEGKE